MILYLIETMSLFLMITSEASTSPTKGWDENDSSLTLLRVRFRA
jgi:hypothetical protein